MHLTATTDKVQLVTTSSALVDVQASWMDFNGTSVTPGATPSAVSSATTTDIIAPPASGSYRKVKDMHFRNKDASLSLPLIVKVINGATTVELMKATVAAGEELVFTEGGGWQTFDVNGYLRTSPGLFATQADQEAGTATDRVVSSGRQHFHPSSAKFWVDASGDGLTTNASYNVSSLTDTGAGLLTVNIGTDFSAANYSVAVSIERASTALTVTNVQDGYVRNGGQAAGTILVESADHTAITMIQEDPTSYYVIGFGDQA